MSKYKTLHRTTHPWVLDSGRFNEVSTFGEWRTREYAAAVAREAGTHGVLTRTDPTG